ncbi:MAG: zinc ribbon domain-containing protein [Syntrophorhabdaceae bacterium]|nr:zinc ribbon domain-containing protein [Syntrophorhabdaceae bacterium]
MEESYCQSCGMPMGATSEMYGSNSDGSKSEDYCGYCFENGAFTKKCSMDEMIEICVPHMTSATDYSEDEARKIMREFFPTLKRWKTA